MTGPPPCLQTPRLELRCPTTDDAPAMLAFAQRNSEALQRFGPQAPAGGHSIDSMVARIERAQRGFDDGTTVRFNIYLRDEHDGPMVGEVGLSNIVRGCFRACHLGYHIDQAHEGKGLMSESLRAVIGHVFDEMKLHRIMANYLPGNDRSARLLERLGFVIEGRAKDYLFINGAWRDHVLTSLTNPQAQDWYAICRPG
ncbi:MAG: GNAT family N-acetyltransferase [Phycisphaerales bacterium]|nr:GNAT family N-acetyltransferase [Phycisphaerales bacterium]